MHWRFCRGSRTAASKASWGGPRRPYGVVEGGDFRVFVFLVQEQLVLNLLGKPWSAVPASVGARSRARGRGPGQRRGCPTRSQALSGEHSLVIFGSIT